MHIKDKSFILTEDSKIIDVIANLNKTGYLICLIADVNNKLLGTITDGDIRRGLLAGKTLDDLATDIIVTNPVISYVDSSDEYNKSLIYKYRVKQIPIVDSENIIQSLYIWDRNDSIEQIENIMLIMAGGFGKRMMPLTNDLPKPMLKISGKPILEHIICNARSQGFYSFYISVHYLAEKITTYFGDGSKWGIKIQYIHENLPLGTAGCMTLFDKRPSRPFVVINGDLISNINFAAILNFHILNKADATMAVKEQKLRNPFGVIKTEGLEITQIEEKPIQISFVNSGIYILNPEMLSSLEANQYKDMPDFFLDLINNKKKAIAFPLHESWQDIGKPIDLNKINDDSSYE